MYMYGDILGSKITFNCYKKYYNQIRKNCQQDAVDDESSHEVHFGRSDSGQLL